MGIAQLGLPMLNREHSDVANVLATNSVRWLLPAVHSDDTQDLTSAPALEISGLETVQQLPANTLCVTLLCTQSARRWQLHTKHDDASHLLAHWLQGANIAELPIELIHAAGELWLAQLCSIRPQLSTLVLDHVALIPQPAIDPATLAVRLHCTLQAHTRSLYLTGPPLALRELVEAYGELKTTITDLPLTLAFICAHTALTLAELTAIRVGDIVLMPASTQTLTQCLLAINQQPCWLASIENDNVTLIEPRTTFMTTELSESLPPELAEAHDTATAAPSPSASTAPVDLEQLPMNIQFELPGTNTTVSELQALAPGYVFTLQDNADAQIKITANGKTLGCGQLVNIEGRLGVQVREWGTHGH